MLQNIEEKLVKCNLNCEGIRNNPKKGIIPRGLTLEKRDGQKKCIVVGLNPGKCGKKERNYFLDNGIKCDSFSKCFSETKLHNEQYFKKTRDLITSLGFNGDILWTNLVKCECFGENGKIPTPTLRVCINKFLRKEIETFKSPTIFALGNVSFNYCALSFPNRFIVGLPHPSRPYGDFKKLNKRVVSNKKYFLKNILQTKDDHGNCRALHLSKI